MDRRAFLATAPLGAGALSGCLDALRPVEIHTLYLDNKTDRPHTFTLRLVADGDVALRADVDTLPSERLFVDCDDLPGRAWRYELFVRIDDRPDEQSTTYTADDECVGVDVYGDGDVGFRTLSPCPNDLLDCSTPDATRTDGRRQGQTDERPSRTATLSRSR